MKESEFNLEELRKSCREARKRFDALPEWEKQAAREILDAASWG